MNRNNQQVDISAFINCSVQPTVAVNDEQQPDDVPDDLPDVVPKEIGNSDQKENVRNTLCRFLNNVLQRYKGTVLKLL